MEASLPLLPFPPSLPPDPTPSFKPPFSFLHRRPSRPPSEPKGGSQNLAAALAEPRILDEHYMRKSDDDIRAADIPERYAERSYRDREVGHTNFN